MGHSMNDLPLHYLGQSQDTPRAAEHPLKYLLGAWIREHGYEYLRREHGSWT